MEFTKEQQDHIDKLIEEKTKGLYDEEELNRRVTAEVDRRVESGIQKGLETHRSKWEQEFKQNAQLTAEELAEKKLQEKLDSITEREKEIQKRSNLIDAKDMLTGADIPKEQYSKFMDLLITDDEEGTKTNVTNFIETFNSTKHEIEAKLKDEMSKIPAPKGGTNSDGISKEDFKSMSYLEKVELKRTNENLYNKLIE